MTARESISRLSTLTPDFPSAGILFRDLTPVFADATAFGDIVSALSDPFPDVDAVAGIDARGFILAAASARDRGLGMVTIRKAGKLPPPVLREEYSLEYGTAALEVRASAVPAGTRILLLDDVLATGGTIAAALRLCERAGWDVVGVSVAIEIAALHGRDALGGVPVHSLLVD